MSPGGAIAGGFAPSDSSAVSETPTPGGALAGGVGPTVRVTIAAGGAIAGAASPTIRVPLAPGGAIAGGFSPTAPAGSSPATLVITTPSIYDRGIKSMSGPVKLVLGTYTFSGSYTTGGETFQLPPLAQNAIVVLFQHHSGYAFSLESDKVKAYDGAASEVAAATDLSTLGPVEFAAITY